MRCCWLPLLLCLIQPHALGAVNMAVDTSRIVFDARQTSQRLRISNQGNDTLRLTTWIDQGNTDGTPESAEAPVMPLPGLVQLAAGANQTLRLLATGLPQVEDRESLYWLNILAEPVEAPETPSGMQSEAAALQVGLRLKLKVFWRPTGLQAVPANPGEQLQFVLHTTSSGPALHISNPTPYYASLSVLSLGNAAGWHHLAAPTLAPFSYLALPLSMTCPALPLTLRFVILDDLGTPVNGQRQLDALQCPPLADTAKAPGRGPMP